MGEGPDTVPLRDTNRLAPFVLFTVRLPESVPGEDPVGGSKVTLYAHALPEDIPTKPPGLPSVGHVVLAEKAPEPDCCTLVI